MNLETARSTLTRVWAMVARWLAGVGRAVVAHPGHVCRYEPIAAERAKSGMAQAMGAMQPMTNVLSRCMNHTGHGAGVITETIPGVWTLTQILGGDRAAVAAASEDNTNVTLIPSGRP